MRLVQHSKQLHSQLTSYTRPEGQLQMPRKASNAGRMYTVSQKKTSPTFLAITRESIDGFL